MKQEIAQRNRLHTLQSRAVNLHNKTKWKMKQNESSGLLCADLNEQDENDRSFLEIN